jgi:hypothetical protein
MTLLRACSGRLLLIVVVCSPSPSPISLPRLALSPLSLCRTPAQVHALRTVEDMDAGRYVPPPPAPTGARTGGPGQDYGNGHGYGTSLGGRGKDLMGYGMNGHHAQHILQQQHVQQQESALGKRPLEPSSSSSSSSHSDGLTLRIVQPHPSTGAVWPAQQARPEHLLAWIQTLNQELTQTREALRLSEVKCARFKGLVQRIMAQSNPQVAAGILIALDDLEDDYDDDDDEEDEDEKEGKEAVAGEAKKAGEVAAEEDEEESDEEEEDEEEEDEEEEDGDENARPERA